MIPPPPFTASEGVTMQYVLLLVRDEHRGRDIPHPCYVLRFDPLAHDGRGYLEHTESPEDALKFNSASEAMKFWQGSQLRAYTVIIEPVLKPWPKGVIALISGRIDDPHCYDFPGQTIMECWNCGHKVRVSQRHKHAKDVDAAHYEIICIQCYAAYRDRANHPVITIFKEEAINPETN